MSRLALLLLVCVLALLLGGTCAKSRPGTYFFPGAPGVSADQPLVIGFWNGQGEVIDMEIVEQGACRVTGMGMRGWVYSRFLNGSREDGWNGPAVLASELPPEEQGTVADCVGEILPFPWPPPETDLAYTN